MQALYELDTTEHVPEEVLVRLFDEPVSEAGGAEPLSVDARSFARELVEGSLAHKAELDEVITKSAPKWPIEQMSKVDKNILRLAIFEILFDNKVPLKAAINEAVELGKRFGSDDSSRFINGVLGTVATAQPTVRKQQKAGPKPKSENE